jgi:glutamine amidotransferase
VIFPGVGQANAAMSKLKYSGLDQLIPELDQPFLGICLGMQLMCSWSEEGDTDCLNLFDDRVIRFDQGNKVPQIGWNQIFSMKTSLFDGVEEGSHVYLVHSYYAPLVEATIASSDYGLSYSTALQKDNFYGVQFHPEKSGPVGSRILQNFLEKCE